MSGFPGEDRTWNARVMASQDAAGLVAPQRTRSREGLRKMLHTVVIPIQTERCRTGVPR